MEQSKDNLTKAERKAIKAQRRIEKNLSKTKEIRHDGTFITILCVRFGNKYSIDYVKKLRNMIERNISIPYELVCLTDDPTPIENVRLIIQKNSGYSRGWWHKVHMFNPLLPLSGKILYMDLDVVICNNIDKIATYLPNSFIGIRDFNRKFHKGWKKLNSSVMSWVHGTQNHIWDQFVNNPTQAMRMHGDQDWIWKTSHDRIKFFPDEWIQSYKWEIRDKTELVVLHGKRQFRDIKNNLKINPECSIAVFHGDPNPCDVHDNFVVDNWK